MAPRKTRRGMGEGSVFKRPGSRFFMMKYTPPGRVHPVRKSTGETTRTAALQVLRAELARVQRDGYGEGIDPTRTTLRDLARLHLDDYASRNLRSAVRVRQQHKALFKFFGERCRVHEITTARLREYRDWRLSSKKTHGGGNISATTVRLELNTFRRMMHLGEMDTPPLVTRVPRIPEVHGPVYEPSVYSPEAVDALLDELPGEHWRNFYEFFYLTGRRPSDIKSLHCADVNAGEGRIRLRSVKTGRSEWFDMTDYTRLTALLLRQEELLERIRRQTGRLPDRFFCGVEGRPLGAHGPVLQRAQERLGIDRQRPYDFKHTAALQMSLAGLPRPVIKQILGVRSDRAFSHYEVLGNTLLTHGLKALDAHHAAQAEKPVTHIAAARTRKARGGNDGNGGAQSRTQPGKSGSRGKR